MFSLKLIDQLFFDKNGNVRNSDVEIDKSCYVQAIVKDEKSFSIKVLEGTLNQVDSTNVKVSLEIDNISEDLSKFSIDDISRKEIVQLVSEHIPNKSEEYYIACSLIVMISLFYILSREFNSPPFSEELIVKISISQSIWKPLFVKYWTAWSRTISKGTENRKRKTNTTIKKDSILSSTSSDDLQSDKEQLDKELDKDINKDTEFHGIFQEGGKGFPVIVEIINRIKDDDARKKNAESRIVEIDSESDELSKARDNRTKNKDKPEDKSETNPETKSRVKSKFNHETKPDTKSESKTKITMEDTSRTFREVKGSKEFPDFEESSEIYRDKKKKVRKSKKFKDSLDDSETLDSLKDVDPNSFSSHLELQVYILSELVKKLLKKQLK
jgi:hypothetical protein